MTTGGCLCGKLRYTTDGAPDVVGKCYCRDCRKETGSGHGTFAIFQDGKVSVEGEAREYVRAGDSGAELVRLFCPSCGTTILGRPKAGGGIIAVRVGTMDDPIDVTVNFASYGSRALPWDSPPAGLTVFDTLPGA